MSDANPLDLRGDVDAYYVPTDERTFEPTLHVQGAWLAHEQHMAPVAGLITHCLQTHNPRDDVQIARITFEILGVMPAARTTIDCETIRSGRTIELDEATLTIEGRVAVRARAWRLARVDTAQVQADPTRRMPPPQEFPAADLGRPGKAASSPPWNSGSIP
ncbi:MAG: thioesterase family protein, partial [Micrococcales bacterium]|nr:thioesterase family protein [Micrococcales bacterium]